MSDAALRFAGVAVVLALVSASAPAAEPEDFLKHYAAQARGADPEFSGFSAERGRALYLTQHPVRDDAMLSCASCHHADPRKGTQAHRDQIPCRACHVLYCGQPASHRPTLREIAPFAPAASPTRITNEWRWSTGLTFAARC
jgi:hypothetical protein